MHPQSNPFPCFLFVTVPLISVTEAASHCSPPWPPPSCPGPWSQTDPFDFQDHSTSLLKTIHCVYLTQKKSQLSYSGLNIQALWFQLTLCSTAYT
jgi:hypothetical protein